MSDNMWTDDEMLAWVSRHRKLILVVAVLFALCQMIIAAGTVWEMLL